MPLKKDTTLRFDCLRIACRRLPIAEREIKNRPGRDGRADIKCKSAPTGGRGGTSLQRRKLIKYLKQAGWRLLRNGSNHDVYTDGTHMEPIPRHNEIDEMLARHILKKYKLRGNAR